MTVATPARSAWMTTGDVAAIVALFALAWLSDVTVRSLDVEHPGPTTLAADAALFAALVLPLMLRRRFPLVILATSTVLFLWIRVLEIPEGTVTSIAMFLALFSAGAYSRHGWRDLVRGASLVVSFGVLIWGLFSNTDGFPGNLVLIQSFQLLLNAAFYAAAWVMGDLWRRRVDDEAELARRAEELDEQRHQLAFQAVADERLRIAQELHDIVGHHVSVMGVQAGAARRAIATDPDGASHLLESIENSGRQAVTEMGRLVGFLRQADNGATAPVPGMTDLDQLVESSRSAGLEVRVSRVGKPHPLDPTTELSAYRVVQEALTNALKHGGGGPTSVEIAYLVNHLSLRVRNPVPAGAPNGEGGRGLVGMAERIGLVGGRLETGRTRDGSFEVQATIPYVETA